MARSVHSKVNALSCLLIIAVSNLMILNTSASKLNTRTFIGTLQPTYTHVNPGPIENAAFEITQDGSKYVFGGLSNGEYNNKLFRSDLHGWNQILESKNSPSARKNSHFLADNTGKLYLLGGIYYEKVFKELYQYCIKKNEWRKLKVDFSLFPTIQDYSMHFDKASLKIYIFGGKSQNEFTNDLYVINIAELSLSKIEAKGNKPTPRSNSIITLQNENLYLFGGNDSSQQFSSDIYALDVQTLSWKKLNFNNDAVNFGGQINGIGSKNAIYLYSPINKNLYVILIKEDIPSMEDLHADLSELPEHIKGYSMAIHSSKIAIFGGCHNHIECTKDVFEVSNKSTSISSTDQIASVQIQISQKDEISQDKPTEALSQEGDENEKIQVIKAKTKKIEEKSQNQKKVNDNFAYNGLTHTKIDNCSDNCSGNGQCFDSECFCNDGFTGNNCSQSNQIAKKNGYSFSDNIKYMIGLAAFSYAATIVFCYYRRKNERI